MCDSVPSARYSSVCNVLRLWSISLIPTYRVYRLYDTGRYAQIHTAQCNTHIHNGLLSQIQPAIQSSFISPRLDTFMYKVTHNEIVHTHRCTHTHTHKHTHAHTHMHTLAHAHAHTRKLLDLRT